MRSLLAGVLAFGVCGIAHAVEVGYCAGPAELSAAMRAEGQVSVVQGNWGVRRWQDESGKWRDQMKLIGVTFSMDPEGKVGYMIDSDTEYQKPGKRFCVTLKLFNVRLYDVRKPGTPDSVKVKSGSEAEVRARCAEFEKRKLEGLVGCTFHNVAIQRGEAIGERVVLQGNGARKGDDGKLVVSNTALITVSMNLVAPPREGTTEHRRGGVDFTFLPEGAMTTNRVLVEMAYTQNALNALAGK